MQYLSSNVEEAKYKLLNSKLNGYHTGAYQGQIQGVEWFLELGTVLDQFREVTEEEKKKLEAMRRFNVEPSQAVMQGQTNYIDREDYK